MNIPSKLPHVQGTIFSTMSQLALQHGAINLGQGFPDYQMSPTLIAGVEKAMQAGHNQYAHSNGYFPLLQAIGQKIDELYSNPLDPATEITITPGATYALFTTMSAFLSPGDEVILFEPAYDSYIPAIRVQGAKPIRIALRFPEYQIPWEVVASKINSKTKLILINSPHNPTGALLSDSDLRQLEALTKGTDILILSDEVYEHVIFDGLPHLSVLKYPGLRDRSLAVFSFGKVYDCTGWKTGYIAGNAQLMKEFRKVHQYNCFSSFSPVQVALADFLQNKEVYRDLPARLQAKRDYFLEAMKEVPLTPMPCSGSFFQCFSFAGITNLTESDFAIWLTKEIGVTAIPVASFYQEPEEHKVLRFCFAKKESTLAEAAKRLAALDHRRP